MNVLFVLINRPASCEVPGIIKLMDAGMTMARFNMSHGKAKVSLLFDISTVMHEKKDVTEIVITLSID